MVIWFAASLAHRRLLGIPRRCHKSCKNQGIFDTAVVVDKIKRTAKKRSRFWRSLKGCSGPLHGGLWRTLYRSPLKLLR